jgi:riboflavin synthase
MFTGIIEKTGRLGGRQPRGGGGELVVEHSPWDAPCREGDSIAVQGVCLTAAQCEAGRFRCDVLQETLRRTTLGAKRAGDPLNLERALRVSDRLGGHIVTGHVDGCGMVEDTEFTGEDWIVRIACDPDIHRLLVPKGSIACDGVSLTVADVQSQSFSVHLIPHTWSHTTFHALRRGDAVNLEGDILAKYARRALEGCVAHAELTEADLEKAGFFGRNDPIS